MRTLVQESMRNCVLAIAMMVMCLSCGCDDQPDLIHPDGTRVRHKLNGKTGILAHHQWEPVSPGSRVMRYHGVVIVVTVDANGNRVSDQWYEGE